MGVSLAEALAGDKAGVVWGGGGGGGGGGGKQERHWEGLGGKKLAKFVAR